MLLSGTGRLTIRLFSLILLAQTVVNTPTTHGRSFMASVPEIPPELLPYEGILDPRFLCDERLPLQRRVWLSEQFRRNEISLQQLGEYVQQYLKAPNTVAPAGEADVTGLGNFQPGQEEPRYDPSQDIMRTLESGEEIKVGDAPPATEGGSEHPLPVAAVDPEPQAPGADVPDGALTVEAPLKDGERREDWPEGFVWSEALGQPSYRGEPDADHAGDHTGDAGGAPAEVQPDVHGVARVAHGQAEEGEALPIEPDRDERSGGVGSRAGDPSGAEGAGQEAHDAPSPEVGGSGEATPGQVEEEAPAIVVRLHGSPHIPLAKKEELAARFDAGTLNETMLRVLIDSYEEEAQEQTDQSDEPPPEPQHMGSTSAAVLVPPTPSDVVQTPVTMQPEQGHLSMDPGLDARQMETLQAETPLLVSAADLAPPDEEEIPPPPSESLPPPPGEAHGIFHVEKGRYGPNTWGVDILLPGGEYEPVMVFLQRERPDWDGPTIAQWLMKNGLPQELAVRLGRQRQGALEGMAVAVHFPAVAELSETEARHYAEKDEFSRAFIAAQAKKQKEAKK